MKSSIKREIHLTSVGHNCEELSTWLTVDVTNMVWFLSTNHNSLYKSWDHVRLCNPTSQKLRKFLKKWIFLFFLVYIKQIDFIFPYIYTVIYAQKTSQHVMNVIVTPLDSISSHPFLFFTHCTVICAYITVYIVDAWKMKSISVTGK